jgi:hypothetical protein
MSPIPPKNINLNFPMMPPLKDAIASPNDKGAQISLSSIYEVTKPDIDGMGAK